MTKTDLDLSNEALMSRRKLAEQATPGPWQKSSAERNIIGDINGRYLSHVAEASGVDAVHIAANDPDTVIATIDELLRLRERVEELTNIRAVQLQEMAADMLNGVIHDETGKDIKVFSLGATCPHCNMQFSTVAEAIEHDATCPKHPATIRAERLEKEADWLAENCSRLEREALWLAGSLPIGAHGSCDDARKRWRDVARRALEMETDEQS